MLKELKDVENSKKTMFEQNGDISRDGVHLQVAQHTHCGSPRRRKEEERIISVCNAELRKSENTANLSAKY